MLLSLGDLLMILQNPGCAALDMAKEGVREARVFVQIPGFV
jgi:hypothetical protein